MTRYRIQEWPDTPGDVESGETVIFSGDGLIDNVDGTVTLAPERLERHRTWFGAWQWLAQNCRPGDTIDILPDIRADGLHP